MNDMVWLYGLVVMVFVLSGVIWAQEPLGGSRGLSTSRPLLFGSGVSAGKSSPALEKYKKELEDRHPFPWPRPLFIYLPHMYWELEDVFEKNIVFLDKHIKPYTPDAIGAGCMVGDGNTVWRGEEGPKDLSMVRPFNIHSAKRLTAFLGEKGIIPVKWASLKTTLSSQLPDDYKARGWETKSPYKQWSDTNDIQKDKIDELVYLEYSNAEVLEWLEDTFDHLVHELGFRYFWIDNYWPDLNSQQVREMYLSARRGGERRGEKIVLRPGAAVPCVGAAEVYAPAPDIQHQWSSFKAVFEWRVPSVFPMLQKHVYTMGFDDFFINQPFNSDQARFICTMWGLAGIEIMETEGEFRETPLSRIRILQKILPLPAVEPLEFEPRGTKVSTDGTEGSDLAHEAPGSWALKLARPFETWHVVGFFNPELFECMERQLDFDDLGLTGGEYLAWDFWEERFLGVFSKGMKVKLGPTSCTVVALREATGVPQVLSTDRHITQGGEELADCKWSKGESALSGKFVGGVDGRQFSVFVYVPHGFVMEKAFGNVSNVETISANVLRVLLNDGEEPGWGLNFKSSGTSEKAAISDDTLIENASAGIVGDTDMVISDWTELAGDEAGYETRVTIPEGLKGDSLRLYIATREECSVEINGKECKCMISPASQYTYYIPDRAFELPPDAIKYGDENVLIIRNVPDEVVNRKGFRACIGFQIDCGE